MGTAAARDCASSTVCCALSRTPCEASARSCNSCIFFLTGPLRPPTFPEMRRLVGASVAWAMRKASLHSRISAALMVSGSVLKTFASGSAIIAAFSQSISTLPRREASSPNNFSAAKACSWSRRTFRCSSTFACAVSKRSDNLPTSSFAESRTTGAMFSASLSLFSTSLLARAMALKADFTARSVSLMAPDCTLRSSSDVSIARGAARMETLSASSSAAVIFCSRTGSMASSFLLSSSSLR
mmetsp:Transcript_121556/g.303298  ORF Transcript_121556/g.303298 Transcript_121556/m.303298 type:complete len:241 (+) Transcript_121556:2976-3698(+)